MNGPPQPDLDRLARVAAGAFDAPIALLSLLDGDRQRVLSRLGLEPRESESMATLCAEAAGPDGPVVVADLREDPRFARSPLVTGPPGIRFLAIAPLAGSSGVGPGVLCVADVAPRAPAPPEQLRALTDLAALAGDQIELAGQLTESLSAAEPRMQLAAIVDSSDDAILGKTLDGTITSWNRGAQALYGYSAQEIVGKNVSTIVPPDRPNEVTNILEHIRRGEPVDHLESVRIRKDGTSVEVSLTISPIRNRSGTIVGASTIARDIGERKRMDAALAAARDAETEANRMKSEFLARMSHEIRTPMNGVIGMAGLLLDTELEPEQREYAEAVRSSGEALLTIINEILDFSKIEAGRMELELAEFDLRVLLEDVADLLAERAHAKGVEMAVLLEPNISRGVRGDPGRLRQVLTNLLGNAVKFTDRGEVVVRVALVEEADGAALLRFEVADTGPGIPPEKTALLFEPFFQADASTTRIHGGTGLGLAISKQLVELMGGEIGVKSTPGEGSCFWFTARLTTVRDVAPRAPARDDLRGLHVLVVDDNKTNRTILERQAASWGMRAGVAEGAEQALELLRGAEAAGESYDVALLDMEMPGMDGLELARAIVADERLPAIPLVLLTSSARRGTADEARAAGISAFLTKPVRQSALYDALALVMGSETAPPSMITRQTISEAKASARPRLLLAEDSPVNQQVAVAMLRKLGYSTDVVADGVEALDALSRRRYGAVLMDCQMPEMDGFQATREIRRREADERHTPIIAMTAGAMKGDREKCLAAGMDDYLPKPVDLDKLGAVLDMWVGEPATVNAVDRARLNELRTLQREGEPDVVGQVVAPFLAAAPSQIETLRAAAVSQDAQALEETAHALKGAGSNLGASMLAALCAELEGLVRGNEMGGVAEVVARIETEFERVREAFETELRRSAPEPGG